MPTFVQQKIAVLGMCLYRLLISLEFRYDHERRSKCVFYQVLFFKHSKSHVPKYEESNRIRNCAFKFHFKKSKL